MNWLDRDRSILNAAVLLGALWLATITLGSVVIANDRPNVVVILADDMGYGDVRALQEASRIPTPHLDSLSAAGLTFTDAHSPSAVCTPTRYGLLTGRYCWRSRLKRGVLGGYSEPLLEEGRWTIADLLQAQGYTTAVIGKWHLGMQLPMLQSDADVTRWDGDPGVDFAGKITNGPNDHGFDYCFCVSASLDMAPYVYIRQNRFTQVPTLQQEAVKFPHFVRAGPRAEDFVIDEVLDRLAGEAVDFIEENAGKEDPFFLYLPLTGPHKPTQPHERFRGKTTLGEYGDFVHQVDWTVGRVLDAIDQSNESENTLVVFTSDNGSYMYRFDETEKTDHVEDASVQGYRAEHHRANGPLRGTKADIWEAGHRVPCFVRWPARIRPGTQSPAVVCLTDLFATMAEIVGADIPENQAEDSVSWVQLFSATRQQNGNSGAELKARGVPVVHHSAAGMFAIRDGRWKLICGNGSGGRQQPKGKPFEEPFQLFDLSADIGETRDLASAHPDVVERLTARLDEIRREGRSAPTE